MKASNLIFILLFTSLFALATPPKPVYNNCPPPINLEQVSQTDSSISFDWEDCGCDYTEYRIFYVKDGSSSQEFSTPNSDFTISGLSSGAYDFHFYTICGGIASVIIVEEIIIL